MGVKVSVIMPVFNRPREFAYSLASILAQDFRDFETIIVDDGSNPPLEMPALENTRLIRQLNAGAGAARSRGAREARGVFLAFLDASDLWRFDKLSRQVAMLESAPPEVGGVFCDFLYGSPRAKRFALRSTPQVVNWHDLFLDGCHCSPGSTLLLRRTAFEMVGPQDPRGDLRRLEDWEYCFLSLREPLAMVLLGGRPKERDIVEATEVLAYHYLPGLGRQAVRLRATLLVERAMAAHWNGKSMKAVAILMRAFVLRPLTVVAKLLKLLNRRPRIARGCLPQDEWGGSQPVREET